MTHLAQSSFCNGRFSFLAGPTFLRKHFTRFPFNKNSCLKFRKIHVPSGTVHFSRTDQIKATASLVIVLVSRIQISGPGENNLISQMGGDILVRPTGSNPIHIGRIAKARRFFSRLGGCPPRRDRFSPYQGKFRSKRLLKFPCG